MRRLAFAVLASAFAISLPLFAEQEAGTRFAVAIERNDAEAVKALLDEGVPVDTFIDYGEHKITPLMKAAWEGDATIVEMLLAAGAKIEDGAHGMPPLQFAASAGKVDMIRFLVKRGANVNYGVKAGGQTALLYAIYGGHVDAVKALIELKADVNAKTKDGDTPLSAAKKGDQEELIAILKAAGAKK